MTKAPPGPLFSPPSMYFIRTTKPWDRTSLVLEVHNPPRRTGRRRADPRVALDAIIFRLRSGRQWNRLPAAFPNDSSVHRTFKSRDARRRAGAHLGQSRG